MEVPAQPDMYSNQHTKPPSSVNLTNTCTLSRDTCIVSHMRIEGYMLTDIHMYVCTVPVNS